MYELIFYEDARGVCPVNDLISELDSKGKRNKDARIQLEQIMFQLDLLERTGTRCSSEYVKHIRGDIWELRPGVNRILLFAWKENKLVLLHAFRKRTQKTPEREIRRAEMEIDRWLQQRRQ